MQSCRSSFSKMVDRDEIGSAFSILGIVQALLPLGKGKPSIFLPVFLFKIYSYCEKDPRGSDMIILSFPKHA